MANPTETAKRLRTGALSSFSRAANDLEKNLNTSTEDEVLKVLFNIFEKRFASVLQRHEDYLASLVDDDETADVWSQKAEERYQCLQVQYAKTSSRKIAADANAIKTRSINIKEQDVNKTI